MIELRVTYACDECGIQKSEKYEYTGVLPSAGPVPHLLEGWTLTEGVLRCDRHGYTAL